jgi:hypothetical protein
MAWGNADSETGGIRGRVGKWLLKQALRLIPVEQLRCFHWYPDGHCVEEEGKQHVVISDHPVEYWSNFDSDVQSVYAVKDDSGTILGLFWMWTEARGAAGMLSQHYNEYHFCEHALNEDDGRVRIAEDQIDGLKKNLHVEKIPLFRAFNYDEWPDNDVIINGDNVRTMDEIRKAEGLSSRGNN